MMSPEEQRLECLKLAVEERAVDDKVALAQRYYDFLLGKMQKPECREVDDVS